MLISRREALTMLAAGAVVSAAPDQSLHFSALDHVEFFASDVQKSVAFYAKIFGNTVLKNNRTQRRYLQLGSSYIAIDQGQEVHVDHLCAAIEGFQVANVHAYLDQRGIAYKDYPSGKDLYVSDPDGTHVQLAAATSWSEFSKTTASPESIPISGERIFRPTGMDHILLNVSDPEKSAASTKKSSVHSPAATTIGRGSKAASPGSDCCRPPAASVRE